MKRLGIFFCSDKKGIIDDYIFYLLEDISENLEELCIVLNTDLSDYYQEKIKKYTENIIFSLDNKYNAGSWRDAIVNYYGFEKLLEFDEVVLFDDSFFGPVYPFKIMFDKMASENIDFWGITDYGEGLNPEKLCPYNKPPHHIQTYFLVFRKNLIKSNEFQKYWKDLPDYETYKDFRCKHEVVFTKYFSDLGYKWKVYIPLSQDELNQRNMDLLSYDLYDMVANKHSPIIKKNAFIEKRELQLKFNLVMEISKTIEYLKENSSYDVSLIYNYLLRIFDPFEIVNILNLVRIFPKNINIAHKTNKKILLIVHVYYDDLWEYDFKYLKNVPQYIDILITTDSDAKKEFFEEIATKHLKNKTSIIKINSRGRDMASLLVDSRNIVKNYDYFCFIHDKKPHANDYVTWAKTFRDVLWESNLASESYINQIIQEFDENKSLGLIVPPKIYHGNFFHGYVNNYWGSNFDMTKELLEQMGINTPIKKSNPPLSLGNCFWAKFDALEPIFDLYLEHDDFSQEPMDLDGTISHAIERIYPYVAASRGYLTEIGMTEDYAKSDIINRDYMFLNIVQKIYSKNKDEWFKSFHFFNMSFSKYIKKLKK